jgi:hypothetical protein
MSKQNEKLLKNIEEYEKEKAKQQESKIHGQKQVKQARKHSQKARVYDS